MDRPTARPLFQTRRKENNPFEVTAIASRHRPKAQPRTFQGHGCCCLCCTRARQGESPVPGQTINKGTCQSGDACRTYFHALDASQAFLDTLMQTQLAAASWLQFKIKRLHIKLPPLLGRLVTRSKLARACSGPPVVEASGCPPQDCTGVLSQH